MYNHSCAALFINLETIDEELCKEKNVTPHAFYPVLEFKPVKFQEVSERFSDDIPEKNIPEKNILQPYILKQKKFRAICPLNRSFNEISKITAQISFNTINGGVLRDDMISDIILRSSTKDDIIVYDHLTPHFLSVYYDCFTQNKASNDLVTQYFSSNEFNNIITLPLPFYFDRQNTSLDVIGDNPQYYEIEFILSEDFINNNFYSIIDINDICVKLLAHVTVIKPEYIHTLKNRYRESIEPYEILPLMYGPIQCFTFREGGLCKNKFFSIIDKHGKYVTQKIIKKISVLFEMTTSLSLSTRDATIMQHFHSDIIPNKNHILINYGGAKFSNEYSGSCLNTSKLNNTILCLEFNDCFDDGKYFIVGFRTMVHI